MGTPIADAGIGAGLVAKAFSSAPSPLVPLLSAPAATELALVPGLLALVLSASTLLPSLRSPIVLAAATVPSYPAGASPWSSSRLATMLKPSSFGSVVLPPTATLTCETVNVRLVTVPVTDTLPQPAFAAGSGVWTLLSQAVPWLAVVVSMVSPPVIRRLLAPGWTLPRVAPAGDDEERVSRLWPRVAWAPPPVKLPRPATCTVGLVTGWLKLRVRVPRPVQVSVTSQSSGRVVTIRNVGVVPGIGGS